MKNKGKWLFSSESVTEGHPDKVCDQISDAILDAIINDDPNARVACETAVTTGMVLVMGEITTSAYADIPRIVRDTVRSIGYTGHDAGFDADACAVLTSIDEQSPDIAMGVDHAWEERSGLTEKELATGAGDQGMMFGFANKDTDELMPLPISLAHRLTSQLAAYRKSAEVDFLRPDGKAQVTIAYEDQTPVHIDTVVVSTQHADSADQKTIERTLREKVIKPVLPADLFDDKTRILVNPTGRFVVGGPQGDSGLTGRKIIVDTYGGYARHGGGAFSGKDPTKVDRSAAYAARYAAKNLVAADLADICEIQLAYAIGVAKPISVMVNTFGTGKLADDVLSLMIQKHIDFRPAALIEMLRLKRPIYHQVASYGHFGRPELDLPWEKTDLKDKLRHEAGRL